MKFLVFVTLASFMALSQCGVILEPQEKEIAPLSLIDPIIKAILEKFRPKLANLTLNNINETIRENNINASILVQNILIKNADGFVIHTLKSNMVPLQLVNLTLTWDNITASAVYDIDVNLTLPNNMPTLRFFAKGDASASLENILFTIGANFEYKNNALQVKPKGLFGFDLIVKKTNITLTSILGTSDLGKSVSVLLSQLIPQLIDTLKKPLFNAYQADIIKIVNQILKKNGTFVNDENEFQEAHVLETLDLSKEMGSFLTQSLESFEENNFEFNF